MRRTMLSMLTAVLVIGGVVANRAGAEELKVGDVAPAFELVGSDGETYKLADLADQAVVIAWFPKAFTGGCTIECKSLRDAGEKLGAYQVAYFAASTDTVEDNTKFAASLELNYPILSDPDGDTARAYGVIDANRPRPQRWTFYIVDGKIAAIDKAVKTASHGDDITAKLEALGVKKSDAP